MSLSTRIEESAAYIQSKLGGLLPTVGLILGSGLGAYADDLEDTVQIPYAEVPGFLVTTAPGHRGQLVAGRRAGVGVLAMQGRSHFYEGYGQGEITLPVRVMKKLGIDTIIITNAAGGVNEVFTEGALMLISDHINFSGSNPLIGPNLEDFGTRFPAMTKVYDATLRRRVLDMTRDEGIQLHEGVYMMFSGPGYETPAEIRFARTIGADAVGMSTVPEVIVAAHAEMRVLGISCITNMAAGMRDEHLSHSEVEDVAKRTHLTFVRVLDLALAAIKEESR
ncbi:MAG: purine-nucleoside phosphorylase [Oscillospiraceae bacterium]|nr:purine-nucleoside phosphorylase [Oscillospiraceae bacterium]